jgi:phosphoserine aminotransferase
MLCVADYLDAIDWVKSIGGVKAAINRSENNLKVIKKFVESNDWISFLAVKPDTLSSTSICLILDLEADKVKRVVKLLEQELVAYDIGAYRDAPAGLRIWGGATVESSDLEALMPWIKWAYHEVL